MQVSAPALLLNPVAMSLLWSKIHKTSWCSLLALPQFGCIFKYSIYFSGGNICSKRFFLLPASLQCKASWFELRQAADHPGRRRFTSDSPCQAGFCTAAEAWMHVMANPIGKRSTEGQRGVHFYPSFIIRKLSNISLKHFLARNLPKKIQHNEHMSLERGNVGNKSAWEATLVIWTPVF